MGYMRHHAIVVTTWTSKSEREPSRLTLIHQKALDIFDGIAPVSDCLEQAINGYVSFLIGPDGSKEGWDSSDAGDAARQNFIEWLETQRHDDGSSWINWVEVQYGDEEHVTKIVNDSDRYWRDRIRDEEARIDPIAKIIRAVTGADETESRRRARVAIRNPVQQKKGDSP